MREITLAEKIRRFRNRTGWTQKRLAQSVGLTPWQISKLENKLLEPTPAQEKRILEVVAS